MILYHLSSRQLNSLGDGERFRIAIPVTYDYPEEGSPAEKRQWFVDALPNVDPSTIGRIETMLLWAHLTNRGGSMTNDPAAMTLATRLGELVDEKNRERLPCYPVECLVASIGGENSFPPRWPNGRLLYVKHESDSAT